MAHNLGMAPYRLSGSGICPPNFKQPPETNQITSAPSNPKKRRKTSNSTVNQLPSQQPPTPQDLLPPPLTGYGDTIIASNPFDDTPPSTTQMSHTSMNHMGMHGGMNPHLHPPHHMGGPPIRGMSPLGMNNMSQMGNMGPLGPGPGPGPGMQCGGPLPPHMNNRVGPGGGGGGNAGGTGGMSPMNSMPGGVGMGGMSPMSSMGPSISPMGPMGGMSPINGPPNSHMAMNPNMGPNSNRSIGSPMSGGPIGSPMNSIPMGSPMSNTMGSPLNAGGGPGQQHMNNGQMGPPPMHSPLGNGPTHMTGPRINVPNGAMPPGVNSMGPHQMNPGLGNTSGGPCQNNPMTTSSQMTTTNSLNTMVGPLSGPQMSHHQNVPMSHGSGNLSGGGNSGSGNVNILNGPLGNPMNPNMSHSMQMGLMGLNHPNHPNHQNHPNHPNHHMAGMGGGPSPMGPGCPGPGNGPNMFGPKPMPVSAGKVYPPGHSMVFNPQNPNAPPIYPCGICHKEVNDNDEALFCESGCNFFYHRTCSGMTEAAFQLISKEVYAEWCCDKCLSSKAIPMVKFKC